jgi:hypothetical protein
MRSHDYIKNLSIGQDMSTTDEKPPKRIRVVFCLPGRSFSNAFLIQWSETIVALERTGRYDMKLSNGYSSFVPFARAICLGASVQRGPKQKPFDGKIEYDVLVWIDSDIVFGPQQVMDLIDAALQDHPVVSGIYMMDDGKHFAAVKNWDDAYFAKNYTYEFLTAEDLPKPKDTESEKPGLVEKPVVTEVEPDEKPTKEPKEYIPCAYAGMGFMAIRQGVIEKLDYPWFDHEPCKIGDLVESCSEDVAFCRNLIENKIVDAIMVNPRMRVAHEKPVFF